MSRPEADDVIFIEKAKRGDRDAFNSLVSKYQIRVYQFAFRLCNNHDIASDLTADSFLRVYSNLNKFRLDSKFTTWMFRIVTNCFLDLKKRERIRTHDSLDEMIETGEGEVAKQVGTDEDDPHESIERTERQKAMERAIQRLPDYQRAMIVMYHLEMMSYEEIAASLSLPLGTVKSRLNRSRLALKELLEPVEELFSP